MSPHLPTHQCMWLYPQVQGLPGALPAQMVRPSAGTVTWLLDADSAAGVAPEKWSDDPKAYPRRCVVPEWNCHCLRRDLHYRSKASGPRVSLSVAQHSLRSGIPD